MKRLLSILAMAVLMSACVKPDEPEQPTVTRFSVLGDSFSSFAGTVDPESNDIWHYENIGVTSAEQMWWHKVATEMGWVLEKNNSFSGSLICNLDVSNYYGPHSYLRRMDNLGNPDVIFIFGGTNDLYNRAPLGDFVYSDWTEEQLCTFRPAVAYLLDAMKQQYPKAKLYFLVDMNLCINDTSIDNETRQAFLDSMHQIAAHYDVECIDLFDIHKSSWHPNEQGQNDIYRQVLETLVSDFNV